MSNSRKVLESQYKMKNLILFLIVWILVVGCKNSSQILHNETTEDLPNTLAIVTEEEIKKEHPFNAENKDSLFRILEEEVIKHIAHSDSSYTVGTLKSYLLFDSVSNSLYSPYNFTHYSDVDWQINENGIIELNNWYLWNTIEPLLGSKTIEDKMKKEKILTDSLLFAQYRWFNKHFDSTQEDTGSGSNLKYGALERDMLIIENQNLKDLLRALTDSKCSIPTWRDIPDRLLTKERNHILKERIPYYINDEIYSEIEDRNAFLHENEIWNQLMKMRESISSNLNGNFKNAYDMGTYRLRFNRLRQLKNEFEEYGIMSMDMMEKTTLSDTCSYEELIAFPNFSTKWKEYCDAL